jgi:alpha-beta hydrolase superfamily lysophospholipase
MTRQCIVTAPLFAAALASSAVALAQAGVPQRLGLPGKTFEVSGRPAFLLEPKQAQPDAPKPWIIYAPTLPGFPDVHEKWMHEKFLAAGVAVAGIDVGEAYGSPQGRQLINALYDELVVKQGYSPRPCLFARSRGGLWLSSWAADHPERVAGLIGIYPVFDLTTYPGLDKAAPAYGMSPQELAASLTRHNPVERLDILAKAKIPATLIHGDQDVVVPLKPNSQRFVDVYAAKNAKHLVTLIVAPGQGHNYWPGFFTNDRLVNDAISWAKSPPRP